jgi:adenine deaminase
MYSVLEIRVRVACRIPKAVVFIISCRKTLSTQLTSDLNAISYDKIKGILDVSKNPVTVWQIDSIGRIPPGVIPDFIVIYEISQVTAHAWTGDNNKARFGMTTLKSLIQSTKRLIVTDNDLNEAQIEAFKLLRPNKDYRVVRNMFQPWINTNVSIKDFRHSSAEVKKDLWSLWMLNLKEKMKDWITNQRRCLGIH